MRLFVENDEEMKARDHKSKVHKNRDGSPFYGLGNNQAGDTQVHWVSDESVETIRYEVFWCVDWRGCSQALYRKIPATPKINYNTQKQKRPSHNNLGQGYNPVSFETV